ncbi:MAG TPA: tRNA (guanosine(37)-N1)-methyltransferase TrmD [Candidatus Dojkabacteria bacterium]|jgi:tRNA (guanine37-N1)-methyltransferase|nr:tRNA (guanosine(37)-N1)-methyltransferase TrmD [Candidatus Dojkabacteria bacterium]HQI92642.1 tRNA (guanosine(37)-N1)-methyltransferase TrmD [Candidatus Dojkabacteria bacterium]
MKFDIVTIFPESIKEYINTSILKIAQEKGLVEINIHNLRDWAKDKHHTTDDTPFGGGPGMVMKVEPVFEAIKDLKKEGSIVAITTPRGEKLKQSKLVEFSKVSNLHMIILCGRYEGFDQRIHDNLVDYEFSIGDYVLSGGELPALVLIDGITRLIPGVLGNEESLTEESFNDGNLDFSQYTKPAEFNGWKVPDILLSGDHKKISKWRKSKSEELTKEKRPDLK